MSSRIFYRDSLVNSVNALPSRELRAQHGTFSQSVSSPVVNATALNAGSLVSSGAVSGTSVSATGAVSGASVAATGAVSGATANISGAATVGSVVSSGQVRGASLRLGASGPTITFGAGLPPSGASDAVPAGSIYIRTNGATASEVIYVNRTGAIGEESWVPLNAV
jgi:hypothetical protein